MASWLSIITQSPSLFRTFITAAVLDHVNSPLLHAGRHAELTLVVVGGAVAAAHCWEGLAGALRALALIPDASGSPGTNNAATCFCVEQKAQRLAFPGKVAIERAVFGRFTHHKMHFWKGIKSDVNDPLLITMQSSPLLQQAFSELQHPSRFVIHSLHSIQQLVSLFKPRFTSILFFPAIETQRARRTAGTWAGPQQRTHHLLHSPWLTTRRSICSLQARTCSSHSLL